MGSDWSEPANDGSTIVALTEFGFIVTGSGFDPEKDTSVMQTKSFRMRTIGVATPDQGIAAAKRLVEDGVQLIELCGGFGPLWTGRIIEAIDDAVPIGSVGYGPEAVDRVQEIFAT